MLGVDGPSRLVLLFRVDGPSRLVLLPILLPKDAGSIFYFGIMMRP
jgi:hypothetical protein